jgi:primosomal protein N'
LVGEWAAAGATLVDVGGGHGELLSAVLADNPGLLGVDFDLPHAELGASALLQARGLAGRTRFGAGSFFESVPEGEVLLLKSVLHDWDDARCTELLRRCAQALPPSGSLIVVERLMPEQVHARQDCQAICRSDLNMLVGTGGRERRLGAFQRLLAAAGLNLAKAVATKAGYALLVCRRAPASARQAGSPDPLPQAVA